MSKPWYRLRVTRREYSLLELSQYAALAIVGLTLLDAVAVLLSLAEGTVKNYVTGVLQKIGVRDRTQAAVRARELGLV